MANVVQLQLADVYVARGDWFDSAVSSLKCAARKFGIEGSKLEEADDSERVREFMVGLLLTEAGKVKSAELARVGTERIAQAAVVEDLKKLKYSALKKMLELEYSNKTVPSGVQSAGEFATKCDDMDDKDAAVDAVIEKIVESKGWQPIVSVEDADMFEQDAHGEEDVHVAEDVSDAAELKTRRPTPFSAQGH